MDQEYTLGKHISQYRAGNIDTFTFIVTEDCNLRCSYCYMVHKNSYHVMPKEVGYRAIDFALAKPNPGAAVSIEFIGGEPSLEMDTIKDITDYFKLQIANSKGHPWQQAYMILLGTNGTTYHTPKVQHFVWENRGHISISLTIDGIKEKHDMHRVFVDGSGSYDIVAKNAKLWMRQFPSCVPKVTFASQDLCYLCDSIVHLWEIGIKEVSSNVVFENVWKPGDAELFEEQLRKLVDVSFERGYWNSFKTNLFWMFKKEGASSDDKNWCGTGKMVAIDSKGDLYPCVRFQGYSLTNPQRKAWKIGNIYDGYDDNSLRAFYCLRKSLQSKNECLECKEQELCAWCSGFNYDVADSDTIFQRATYNCEMHKAQWRANHYYWEQLEKLHGIKPRSVGDLDVEEPVGCLL